MMDSPVSDLQWYGGVTGNKFQKPIKSASESTTAEAGSPQSLLTASRVFSNWKFFMLTVSFSMLLLVKLMNKELENHINELYQDIGGAAKKRELAVIQQLATKIEELEALKHQQAAIQQRVTKLIHSGEDNTPSSLPISMINGALRELPIHVTEGMIRQNLLTLTPHVKRGRIKIGEELTIEALPSGETFRTVVMDNGNKLQARAEISRFYKDAKVQPDDYVLLIENSPGCWILKKAPPMLSRMP
jgi:hypothetical protein